MDKSQLSRLMIGMAVAMLVVVGWSHVVQYLRQKNPNWDWGTPATQPANQVAATQPVATPTTTVATTTPTGQAVMTTQPLLETSAGLRVQTVQGASPTLLGSAVDRDPNVPMSVSINPRGAGLNSVVLNDFKRTVDKPDRYIFQEPYSGSEDDESRPLATRSITIGTETVDLRKVEWKQVHGPTTQSGAPLTFAAYRVVIVRGDTPIVNIDKTYTLSPRSNDENTPQGFEVQVQHIVTNLTDQPLTAKLSLNGPMAPPVETDNLDDRQVVGGYNHAGHVTLEHSMLSGITKDSPTKNMSKHEDGHPLVWTGMTGVYFNALVRPDQSQPIKVESAVAQGLNFDKPMFHHVILKLETNTFELPGKASKASTDHVFFGPRRRALLQSDYYAAAPVRYDSTLVMTSGPCGFCTWNWLVNGLYYLLAFFHAILRDWGLAIICLVLIVRACLHPITKRAQINMSKMSKMGPEIERLKKKYADNKDELNKAMMQFYKQQGATPILGCLPMFLQMPIWIALYSALQSTFELRQAPFLWGFTWIDDLAHADRLVWFPQNPFKFWFIHIDAINVLPVILGVVSFIQAKIMQAQQPPSTTPEQETQKKMMVWMSLLLPVILYNGPSGLNLYIITSTTLGILESHIVRKHIKEREALEAQGAVIVDSPPPDKDDRPPTGKVRRKPSEPDKPTGGLAGWLTKLQQKAEDMQREAEKRNKKKK